MELILSTTLYRAVLPSNDGYEWIYQSFYFKQVYYWYMENYWEYDGNLRLQEFKIDTYEYDETKDRIIK